MTRLSLVATIAFALVAGAALAADESAQTVGDMRYSTANYQLVVWSAGHFALKVGGSWMPGCVCLSVGNAPQYQTDQLSYMEGKATPIPGGRRITITGRLTPDVAFTQTLDCVADNVTLRYAVQALKDAANADIRLTAGPQTDQMNGKTLEIETAAAKQSLTWPLTQPLQQQGVRSLNWHDVGMREARTVFVQCAASEVSLSDKRATYTAWLRKPGAMKQGETAEATMRFEAIPIGDAAVTVANVSGKLGVSKFTVGGKNGLLSNVRTDQGLLIQQLSLNEQDLHQVSIGQGKGAEWGGVKLARQEPGKEYLVEGKGAIINDWQETIAARSVGTGRDEIRWSAHRTLDKGPQRLRVLMYVAQWLEQERNPYFIRTPEGKIQTQDAGEALWFGMPPKSDDPGLGRYRKLGTYPAGTEIVVPMLSRGEQLTVRLGQPMEIDGFRFEIYFRGLWFEALDNKQKDLDLTMTVEKLPQRQVGTLQVAEDPLTGAVKLGSGGIPLLEQIVAKDGQKQVVKGTWEWRADATGGQGTLTVKAKTVEMRVPEWLWGKTVRAADKALFRLGSAVPAVKVAAGNALEFAPNALERLSITCASAMTAQPVRLDGGNATLVLTPRQLGAKLIFRYAPVSTPVRDAIAARKASGKPQDDPGVYGGLSVREAAPGDFLITTPWWEVNQRAAFGGVISSIHFANGSGGNILAKLPWTQVDVTGETYCDSGDQKAKLTVEQATPTYVRLKVTGRLVNAAGKALCPIEQVYEYRPMLVRRTVRILLGDKQIECTGLSMGSMTLQPSLDECAYRHTDDRTTWGRAVFPGPAVVEHKDFSQYLCLFRRGVEGIDWTPASDLSQWWGVGGRKDGARYGIVSDGGNPRLAIEPIALGSQPVPLTGTLTFESYLSLPQTRRCLQRRNFVACLGNGECTPEMLRQCADYGVTDIMLGCANNPGSFELTDLKASQKTVQAAAQYRMMTYPFDPFQLVNRRVPLWQQHDLMERRELRNGKSEVAVFSDYGDYFCPSCKEFAGALKTGYKKLVESADFGGLYHDFTHPYTCYNQKHWPPGTVGPTREGERAGAAVPDAQGHINTDGVLDVVLWDREFLGKDRVFCGHTGWVPTLFFQDLCTVTAIFEEYPSTEPLPLYLTPAQGEFVNAAQRTLVSSFLSNGAGAPGEENPCPPAEIVDAYLSRCALVGIFPWMNSGNMGATDSYDLLEKSKPWYRLFALRGKNDLGTMQFLPWHRQTAVVGSNPFVRAATYWNADRAIIVLANSESAQLSDFAFTVLPEQFGWAKGSHVALTPTKDSPALVRCQKMDTFQGTLPGFGWSAYEVSRK